MGYWIFLVLCLAVVVVDIVSDPKFREKLKNVEE
jgi:hypothetical protein